MSNKQFFASLGSLISGGISGYVLQSYPPPYNFAYLFMSSAFFMGFGLFAFSTIDEPIKKEITKKEDNFLEFLKNSFVILKLDQKLRIQILITLFGYSFLLALPFIIINAKNSFDLSGWIVGSFISIQMIGSMFGNLFLWKRFTTNYIKMMQLALMLMIFIFVIAYFATNIWEYIVIFFVFGVARDGFRNADMNLTLEIAPQNKRPVYVAIQSTLSSIGLFLSIVGGFILQLYGYDTLFIITIIMLLVSLIFTKRLSLLHSH